VSTNRMVCGCPSVRHEPRGSGRSAVALGVLLGSLWAAAVQAEAPGGFFQPVQPPRPIQVVAHRGVTMAAPENTIPAFSLAYDIGVEWVECDIRLTKDGHHVLSHDGNLGRATDVTGPVSGKTLEEIKQIDAGVKFAPRFKGTRIPTFPELLAWAKGKVNLYMDCKNIDPVKLTKEILDAGMERQVIAYDDINGAVRLQQASGGRIPIMPDYDKTSPYEEWIRKYHPAAFEVDATVLNDGLVKAARAAGIAIQTDALGPFDNPTSYRRLIDRGVNWLQSDRQDQVLAMFYKDAVKDRKRPLLAVHRGVAQLAPENTLAAVKKAIEYGLDMVEIDVHLTADGKIVVIHDGTLDRTTTGKGPVAKATLEEIRKLNAGRWFGPMYAGEKVPTLAEVLELCKGKIRVKIDAKGIDPKRLANEVRASGAPANVIVLETPAYLERLMQLAPEIPRKTWFRKDEDIDQVMAQAKPELVELDWARCTADRVAECHKRGVKVMTYSPNVHLTTEQYITRMKTGVDVVQTDHPLLVMRAVEVMTGQP
jgi:glycerophosphoryl diester phosphodiesterase